MDSMQTLTDTDILGSLRPAVKTQQYGEKVQIEGVKSVEIRRFATEDGTFEDMVRIDERGRFEAFPEFQLRQINRSYLLPAAIKAWHLHYNQEDIWYVPPQDHMILGLWDVRESSPTKDTKMRIVLGDGVSKLVYIPRGVAHGVVNVSPREGTIFYYVNQQFTLENPDERRLPWDAAGKDFWEIPKQ